MNLQSEYAKALAQLKGEVRQRFDTIGRGAVEEAKAKGNYRNRTGHLRSSNKYRVSDEGLEVYNDAEYASDVEKKGYDVQTSARLYVLNELSKK